MSQIKIVMSKKLVYLLILSLAVTAQAGSIMWTGMLDNNWNQPANWTPTTVPTAAVGTNSTIGYGGVGVANVAATDSVTAHGSNVGKSDGVNPGHGTLNIYGSMAVTKFVTLGRETGDTGLVNVDGGTLTLGWNVAVGQKGNGTVNVLNGGSITAGLDDGSHYKIAVPGHNGVGTLNISDGTVTTPRLQIPGWYPVGNGFEGHGEIHISGNSTLTTDVLLWGDQETSYVPTTINGSFIKLYDTSKLILTGDQRLLAWDAILDGLIICDDGHHSGVRFEIIDGNTVFEIAYFLTPEPTTIILLTLGCVFLRHRK